MVSNILPGSFVAISDLNSYDYPFDKVVDYYLNEYETIYILGDAINTGQMGHGGIEVLSRIKDLSEKTKGRVVYIPGNYDSFLYDYGAYNEGSFLTNMEYNKASILFFEFDKLRRIEPRKAKELINWLGDLPLQISHEFDDMKFALAHAFFNQNIYDENPNFSLKDLHCLKYSAKGFYDYLGEIIWFRKNGNYLSDYSRMAVPSKDTAMIIGHTSKSTRRGQDLDLENAQGDKVRVYGVDREIAFDGDKLKNNGAFDTYFNKKHASDKRSLDLVAPSRIWDDAAVNAWNLVEKEDVLRKIILEVVKKSSTLDEAKELLGKFSVTGDVSYLPYELRKRASVLTTEKMDSIIIEQYYTGNRLTQIFPTRESFIYDYINETIVDHTLLSLEKKFDSKAKAVNQLTGAIAEQKYSYITDSIGSARTIAKKLGFDGIKETVLKCGYNSIKAYSDARRGKSFSY